MTAPSRSHRIFTVMFGRKPTPKQFWAWFVSNEAMLYDFEKDMERIFKKLAAELNRVDPNLTFEFGPQKTDGREFVVSAGGIKSSFPAVVSLVSAAPKLERWKITAFRPRRYPINRIQIETCSVDPEKVEFTLLDNGKTAGIHLFIPGLQQNVTAWKQIGYLLLDEALGEYDVETKLGIIKLFAPEAEIPGERIPLAELPDVFDRHVLTLAGRSSGPSIH